jgi:thiol-disulfide isomerase/thioredoxin
MSAQTLPAFTRQADPYKDLLVIDSRAPRFNQVVVATGSLIAVLTGFWPIFLLLGAQLAVSVIFGRKYCLPCVFYFEVVQPRFGEGELEDSRAPRFANLIGAAFLLSAAALSALGFVTFDAVLGSIVAALAGLAVSTGLCVGCEVYKIIARLRGIKGGILDRIDLDQLGVVPEENLVVLFTHPLCSECHEVKPQLEREGRRVISIDVSQRKDLAKKYGVTLVPLAVTVGADGRVRGRSR